MHSDRRTYCKKTVNHFLQINQTHELQCSYLDFEKKSTHYPSVFAKSLFLFIIWYQEFVVHKYICHTIYLKTTFNKKSPPIFPTFVQDLNHFYHYLRTGMNLPGCFGVRKYSIHVLSHTNDVHVRGRRGHINTYNIKDKILIQSFWLRGVRKMSGYKKNYGGCH